LSIATTAAGWVHRHTSEGAITTLATLGIPFITSGLASFVFLVVVYRVLTNVELHRGDVWPGAMFGAISFAISFQVVPIYLQFATNLVTLQVFGGIVLLLVWLYLMANIIVLGAEINWRHWARSQPPEEVSGLA
jgi:membrane protein